MTTDKKPKRLRMITPKGVAIFPWLNTPDTKFKDEGEYRVTLRLDAEKGEELIKRLQPLHDAGVKAAQKDPKKKGKKLDINDFYKKVVDDNGDETGEIEFRFSAKASGKSKKTGKEFARKIDLFDARGERLPEDTMVWGGSLIKVSFNPSFYDTPKSIGLKLYLESVQVIKLVSSQRDAKTYGFGDESDDDDADAPASDGADDAGDGGDGDNDEF